jgi:hypothetical protein
MGIVIADDCEIESMLQRRARPTSRVLFAGVSTWPVAPSEVARTKAITSFRRHPLEPGAGFQGGVVEFQRLFAVAAEAMGTTPDPRVVRLSADARIEFEIRWVAFSTRRGPRAHLDGAEKLARLITADGNAELNAKLAAGELAVDDAAKTAGIALAKTLSRAWDIEGRLMNSIADAHERGDPAVDSIATLAEALTELSQATAEAIAAVDSARPAS